MTTTAPVKTDKDIKEALIAQTSQLSSAPKTGGVLDFPTEEIDLPSQGKCYPTESPLSKGSITMKYMTTREEDILTSQNLINKGIAVEQMISSLIVTKFDHDDLISGDYDAIMMAARILGYGPSYNFKLTCPACGYNHKQGYTKDLRQLSDKVINWEAFTPNTGEYTITTPIGGDKIVLRLSDRRLENLVTEELKGLAKLNLDFVPEYSTRLKHLIVSINGNTDKAGIRSYVDRMLAPTSRYIREQIKENTPGINRTFEFKCSECQHEEELTIPIDISFFWPGA